MTRELFSRRTTRGPRIDQIGVAGSNWSPGNERGKLKDSMLPHLGYLHYVNARVLHYVSAPCTGRWITLMSRGRLGPLGHKSDLYTNMSALVAAKSLGFKSEIRLASIAGGWSGRHDPIRGRSASRRWEESYCFAVPRAPCSTRWNIQRHSLRMPALCSVRLPSL